MASKPELHIVKQGNSLFALLNKYCRFEADGLYNPALHRLCSLMRKMNVKTAVVETMSVADNDIHEECEALNTYYKDTVAQVNIEAYKLTFLSEEIASPEELRDLKDEDFLSSAIIINFYDPNDKGWRSYLYNAIVSTPQINNHKKYGSMPLLNNYLHISKKFNCKVSISDDKIHEYKIAGTFFCQQNSKTSVCANASLCMVINNQNSLKIVLVTPEDINKKLGINHIDIKFGFSKSGFSNDDINKVLNDYGLSYTLLDFYSNPNREYDEWIYSYTESKYPVLLIFTTDTTTSHVVPILGHTLNSDTWKPEAELAYSPAVKSNSIGSYKSSAAWVDHFIIHDDNFGMYLSLPVGALKRVTLPKHDPSFRANYAIAIIPKGVQTPSWEAEWASRVCTYNILQWRKSTATPLDIWTYRLERRLNDSRSTITRTFLITKDDYKKSLDKKDFNDNAFSKTDKEELIKDLPERFWLTEITMPDLYTANKSKIIDFFYPCNFSAFTDEKEVLERWFQIRFPHILIKRDAGNKHTPIPMSVKNHYPLLGFEVNDLYW
jgi:hypothetical protein